MNIFQEVLVWKRIDNTSSVRYFCFHDLVTGQYCVQSADFFNTPIDTKQVQQFQKQSIELFAESSPIERCEWFESLAEAIKCHDEDFNN